jgi:hypothetical protein
MSQLSGSEIEKVRSSIEQLESAYWREIFSTVFPLFERGHPVTESIRKARDKLSEVIE